MAAENYEIACSWLSAYITRKKKKNNGVMSSDRVAIDEETILMLIDWLLDQYLSKYDKESGGFSFDSNLRDGWKVCLTLRKPEEIATPGADDKESGAENKAADNAIGVDEGCCDPS